MLALFPAFWTSIFIFSLSLANYVASHGHTDELWFGVSGSSQVGGWDGQRPSWRLATTKINRFITCKVSKGYKDRCPGLCWEIGVLQLGGSTGKLLEVMLMQNSNTYIADPWTTAVWTVWAHLHMEFFNKYSTINVFSFWFWFIFTKGFSH